jgi:hypothetical protein
MCHTHLEPGEIIKILKISLDVTVKFHTNVQLRCDDGCHGSVWDALALCAGSAWLMGIALNLLSLVGGKDNGKTPGLRKFDSLLQFRVCSEQ